MERKSKSKIYSVHILTTLPKPCNKYIHIAVKKFYKDDKILYIKEEKFPGRRSIYMYSLDYIKEIRVREIIRGKV